MACWPNTGRPFWILLSIGRIKEYILCCRNTAQALAPSRNTFSTTTSFVSNLFRFINFITVYYELLRAFSQPRSSREGRPPTPTSADFPLKPLEAMQQSAELGAANLSRYFPFSPHSVSAPSDNGNSFRFESNRTNPMDSCFHIVVGDPTRQGSCAL